MSAATSATGRRRLAGAAALGAAATTAGIALTATSGWLVVRASERPAILTLLTAIVAVRTFGIARPLLRYAERLRSHDASLRDLARRRTETYAWLVPLTPARLGRRRRAELLTAVVDDLTDVVEGQVRVVVPVAAAALAGLAVTVVTAMLAPPVGGVVAGLVVATAVVGGYALRLETVSQQSLLSAREEVVHLSHLVAVQGPEVRAAQAGDAVVGALDAAQAEVAQATARQSRGRSATAGVVLVLVGAATVAAALLAAGLDLPLPVKGLLVLTPVAVVEAFQPLVDAVRAAARVRGASTRLVAVLDQEPAIRDRALDAASSGAPAHVTGRRRVPRIELRGVCASWDGRRCALGPLDLVLEPGRRVLVTGPNGGGKSTLVAVLARQLEISEGRYLVDGVDVGRLPLEEVRGLVAVVDDEPHVFATSLRENLRLALPEEGRDPAGEPQTGADGLLVDTLRRAGLGGWFDGLPTGLDTRLGTGGRGVSGGERARLSIARALLSGRPVLLLDEAVAHLDHATAEAVLGDLLRTADGRLTQTIVLVSHAPVDGRHFDAVLELVPPAAHTG